MRSAKSIIKLDKGRVSIRISKDGMTIELRDNESIMDFCKVEINPENLLKALGGLASVSCEIELNSLDKVGKKHIMDTLDFEMPMHGYSNRDEIATKEAIKACPEGWEPDLYFNSQGSFFTKNGKEYARTIIRKWEEQ